jgi:hypothetical protein
MKNELNIYFQQKFATGSYRVGIGRAWCSRKACEICSSLVQKKELKEEKKSSHKLPKQQSTSFWSQGILGVKGFFIFFLAILIALNFEFVWCVPKVSYLSYDELIFLKFLRSYCP